MTSIDGVTFPAAWRNRIEGQMGGIPISLISLQDLIRNKEASQRDTDRIRVDRLRRFGKQQAGGNWV
jgi:hypothetical protein